MQGGNTVCADVAVACCVLGEFTPVPAISTALQHPLADNDANTALALVLHTKLQALRAHYAPSRHMWHAPSFFVKMCFGHFASGTALGTAAVRADVCETHKSRCLHPQFIPPSVAVFTIVHCGLYPPALATTTQRAT